MHQLPARSKLLPLSWKLVLLFAGLTLVSCAPPSKKLTVQNLDPKAMYRSLILLDSSTIKFDNRLAWYEDNEKVFYGFDWTTEDERKVSSDLVRYAITESPDSYAAYWVIGAALVGIALLMNNMVF